MSKYVICRENPSSHKEEFIMGGMEDGSPTHTSQDALALRFDTAREAYAWANSTLKRRARLQWWRVAAR